jgi:4-amino-4-deoxy-L-arabinose transferase-like glycosyltransferase
LLALVLVGLALRLVAAYGVQRFVTTPTRPCVFPDTVIYCQLGDAVRTGLPFQVSQWGVPHYALRTPGYPIFLALCQAVFGSSGLMPVRVVQACLGALSVFLVYKLVREIWPASRATPLVAAALAAVEPYTVGISALVLSEALFVPLMLLSLWGVAALWISSTSNQTQLHGDDRPTESESDSPSLADHTESSGSARPPRHWTLIALGTGVANGAAILTRPSWAIAAPLLLFAWIAGAGQARRRQAIRAAGFVILGLIVTLTPWWVRNARVFHRFAPTAVWVGASLYDGLNPSADGSSEMKFLAADDVRTLDESTQDRVLREKALAFARSNPARVVQLAAVKFARFWSPWPNADTLRAPGVAAVSALITIPLYVFMLRGVVLCRRDFRALVLLFGPVLYFCFLHMIFVSSIRYRVPAEIPALGLAAMVITGGGMSRSRGE